MKTLQVFACNQPSLTVSYRIWLLVRVACLIYLLNASFQSLKFSDNMLKHLLYDIGYMCVQSCEIDSLNKLLQKATYKKATEMNKKFSE